MAGGPRHTRLRWGGRWGTARNMATIPAGTLSEAEALYNLLEREVIPEFYARDGSGIPTAWIKRMRESMALLTPRFSADRTVREYTEQRYLPLLPPSASARQTKAQWASRSSIGSMQSSELGLLRFGEVRVDTSAEHHVFEVEIFLNGLDPNAVRVELYAERVSGGEPVREAMRCVATGTRCGARSCLSGNRTADTPCK